MVERHPNLGEYMGEILSSNPENNQDPQSKLYKRRAILNLGIASVLAIGASAALEYAPHAVFDLKGLPEPWSDDQHIQYLEGLETRMRAATNFEEKWDVIRCLMDANRGFAEQLKQYWLIQNGTAAVQKIVLPGAGVRPPYRADEVYVQYATRLHHCCVLAGGERIAHLFSALVDTEKNPVLRERALIQTAEIAESLNLIRNEYTPESFFKDFARTIVLEQPDFVQELEKLDKRNHFSRTKYSHFYHNLLVVLKKRLEP